MVDRRIALNTNTPSLTQDTAQDSPSRQRDTPADAERERFEQALAGDTPRPSAPQKADSPFALFGAGAAHSAPDASSSGHGPDLAPLADAIEQLMVGEGRNGAMVRVAVADDILPGVSINVSEEGGAWLVECECADEDSRELLCARASGMAQEMADRLGRESLWRVTTDDPEDRRPLEVRAAPGGEA